MMCFFFSCFYPQTCGFPLNQWTIGRGMKPAVGRWSATRKAATGTLKRNIRYCNNNNYIIYIYIVYAYMHICIYLFIFLYIYIFIALLYIYMLIINKPQTLQVDPRSSTFLRRVGQATWQRLDVRGPWGDPRVSREAQWVDPIPSGKHTKNDGKTPFLIGKPWFSFCRFHRANPPEAPAKNGKTMEKWWFIWKTTIFSG